MEVRPHGHQDQIPTSAQEEDHHHSPPEKIKSVMKKVKDKAKKIKNSLTKHGHDHEEDDDDEEEEEDHGDVKIQHQMEEKQSFVPSYDDDEREKNEDGEIKVPKLKRESVVKDDPFMTLEQDPNSPKSSLLPSNYQSKDTDSSSTETTEAGITSSFNKMNISAVDEIKDEQHNQPKSPELSPPGYLTKISTVLMNPGEEDKALSETISDALEWRKKKKAVAVAGEKEEKVMGKVIVSDELAKRLGSCDVDYQNRPSSSSNNEAEGKLPGVSETMVERIKGTVGSWFGLRSGGADQSQASLGTTTTTTNIMAGGDGNNNVGGQKRQGE